MKAVFSALLLSCLLSHGQSEKWRIPDFKTKSGTAYESVVVTKKNADGISIIHAGGAARLSFRDLPDEIAAEVGGFDFELAEKAEAERLSKIQAVDKATDDRKQSAARHEEENQILNAKEAYIKPESLFGAGAVVKVGWLRLGKFYGFEPGRIYVENCPVSADGDVLDVRLIEKSRAEMVTLPSVGRLRVATFKIIGQSVKIADPGTLDPSRPKSGSISVSVIATGQGWKQIKADVRAGDTPMKIRVSKLWPKGEVFEREIKSSQETTLFFKVVSNYVITGSEDGKVIADESFIEKTGL